MTGKRKKKNNNFFLITTILILAFLTPLLCSIAAYFYFSLDLPQISSLKDYRPSIVTEVYSSQGDLIGEFFVEKRYIVGLSDISMLLIQAIIAAEDSKFFEHRGINLWSILRAALKNIRSLGIKQGGSTITQQIVKSLLLTPEKSYSRKIKEAILATRIEKYLSKDDILALYLNQIYFGHGAYGIEAASRLYFKKTAAELNLAEASFLAGLPKAPNHYSPFRNLERAKRRQAYVLNRMVEQGFIIPGEKIEALNTPMEFYSSENLNTSQAPYFVEHIRREMEKKYGADLYREGLRIETTLDLTLAKAARDAVLKGTEGYEKRAKTMDNDTRVQAALFCMEPFSGRVKAMVGGRDFNESQFNRAVQAQRQPGSAFKPIIYAAALDKGYTPANIIIDSPLLFYEIKNDEEYEFWEPENYDKSFLGPVTLRRAFFQSRNIVTIRILKDIGINYVVQYAKQLGVSGTFNHDLSMALGTCGISLFNMVKAYSTFGAGGVSAEPIFIDRIFDRDGNLLEESVPELNSVISPQTAYLMTDLLKSVVTNGTGRRARALGRPCAGKTGTTNDVRDAWFIGYTPQLVTGVWVGFDDLRPLGKNETGAVAASPIWLSFMKKALENEPVKTFKVPDGIVFVKINPETGYFPRTRDEETVFECFKEGTLPTSYIQDYLDDHESMN